MQANTGIELAESMAMWPGASVSGLYFSHPKSQYFVVGQIGRDQVESYAKRKGWTVADTERWPHPQVPPGPTTAPRSPSATSTYSRSPCGGISSLGLAPEIIATAEPAGHRWRRTRRHYRRWPVPRAGTRGHARDARSIEAA